MAKAVKWELIADPRRYIGGFDKAERKTKGFHASIGKLGGMLTGLAGAAGFGVAIRAAAGLEKEWGNATDTIRTQTGKTGKTLDGLVKDFNAVASSVPASL